MVYSTWFSSSTYFIQPTFGIIDLVHTQILRKTNIFYTLIRTLGGGGGGGGGGGKKS